VHGRDLSTAAGVKNGDRLIDNGREKMLRFVLGTLGAVALALPVAAQVHPFPASFRTQNIQTDGVRIHVRVGGQGPAVVLLHGFGDTGDMWVPLAANLARDHTVVVPDLRGMGLVRRHEVSSDRSA